MKVIEPHIHMIARTTQDYERMLRMHTVACCEPAFWAGYDRTSPQAFHDYFTHISEFEPTRAAQYQIQHYAWICINPKEAEDVAFSREVIACIPEFLTKPTVLGVGEIGLNLNTHNEMIIFEEQVELALTHDQLIWIHTPHLKDKLKGTTMMVEYLNGHGGIDPERVAFDHCEEHTLRAIRDGGYWAAMTIYPTTNSQSDCLRLIRNVNSKNRSPQWPTRRVSSSSARGGFAIRSTTLRDCSELAELDSFTNVD